ncbi:MAG TPA: protein-methionine-sulfoxide reductase catalytic subunit MsrP [Vicinamibacteria bacterium]|nr:protein-methionine-sulfoxide reductase catalytic subunit MsrP [Vicinamibacteria bacterium]
MLVRIRRPFEIVRPGEATSESAVLGRRRVLQGLAGGGLGVAAGVLAGCGVRGHAASSPAPSYPPLGAARSPRFTVEGPLTDEAAAARVNNFYEFTQDKDVHRYVDKFQPKPWTVEVTGLVQKPRTWGLEELLKLPLEERVYRFRCVEAWYMNVPWTGFPLRLLLEKAEPLSTARYVRFVSVLRKDEMPGQNVPWYTWPYYEGLRLDEAMNDLTLATVGIYGHELPKQHGAPFRVIVPWKYGYKGPKSVVKVELVADQPRTFWNDQQPTEYSFESNVDPGVPHPRWSQASERSIDGAPPRKTLLYNGYAPLVAHLYPKA